MDADHRGVAPGLDGVGADLAVILLPDPAAAGDVGGRHQLEEVGGDVFALGDVTEGGDVGPRFILVGAEVGALVQRGVVGERAQRDVAHDLAIVLEHHVAGIRHLADDREVEFPFLEDGFGEGFPAGIEHHQHAFLRFGQHHLVGGHARFALGDGVHVQPDSDPALARHFDARRGQAGRAHVLNGDDRVRLHQLEASLDQQFLGKRIADLNGRALVLVALREVGRGHGRTVDAVAARLAADIDDRIADTRGGGVEDFVLIGDPDGHCVDQDVAVVSGVEIDLSADRGDADAIAVAADAGHHARDEVAHPGMIGTAEAQGVQIGDRARAHGKHVAQDAADPGRRALIGLDVGRVIVALHLEDRRLGLAVGSGANVDHTGILARAANHPRGFGGELLQVEARAFVTAMFGPHDRKDAELDEVGLAAQCVEHALIFFRREAVVGDYLIGDHGLADSGQGRIKKPPALAGGFSFSNRADMGVNPMTSIRSTALQFGRPAAPLAMLTIASQSCRFARRLRPYTPARPCRGGSE